MSRTIPLTRGLVAIVDDADYEALSAVKWFAQPTKPGSTKFYAARTVHENGKKSLLYMHCLLLEVPPGFQRDHCNQDRLDNRRANLRVATRSQNQANRPGWGRVGFKGVTLVNGRFRAEIRHHRKMTALGTFGTAEAAARAFDRAAIQIHGVFANLNFPDNANRREIPPPPCPLLDNLESKARRHQ